MHGKNSLLAAAFTVSAALLTLAPPSWAATETVLYSFQNETDGMDPFAPLLSLSGRLYGTTVIGGTHDLGIVFELTNTKSGWVKTTLHDFTGLDDGDKPWAGLAADKAGNLFGASLNGGKYADGVIFELSRHGKRWKFTVIHTFSGADGSGPVGTLVFDDAGNLYGTTAEGGQYRCGYSTCGTIFEMSPSGRRWKLTVLHDFDGGDGSYPASPLYRDSKGILYGTTESGGGNGPCNTGGGCGTIFELSPSKAGWKFTVLHTFNGTDGEFPVGALTMDKSGSLYGTTTDGGGAGYGVVYRLTLSDGKWRGTVLHEFENGSDGDDPCGALAFDSKGNLYGTTQLGGSDGMGTIFGLAHSGRGWEESVPLSFDGLDGMYPVGGLISPGTGRVYGTTSHGGNGDCGGESCGAVFEFIP
jgi:uncharacterized repeat protein (TIGR03803 family)